MVFESLTLVELNLENAHLAPSLGGERREATPDESGGSRAGLLAGVLLLVAVAVAVAARRLRGGEDADPDRITIEQATEQ